MTTILLPFPPGVNNLFVNVGKRRVVAPAYQVWRNRAKWALTGADPHRKLRCAGPFNVYMLFDRPDRRKRDLDGLAKAPLDLLVSMGVIDDDHLAQRITLEWSYLTPAKPGSVTVTLEAAQ